MKLVSAVPISEIKIPTQLICPIYFLSFKSLTQVFCEKLSLFESIRVSPAQIFSLSKIFDIRSFQRSGFLVCIVWWGNSWSEFWGDEITSAAAAAAATTTQQQQQQQQRGGRRKCLKPLFSHFLTILKFSLTRKTRHCDVFWSLVRKKIEIKNEHDLLKDKSISKTR